MANFPEEVLENYQDAKQYLSNLNAAYISDLKRGCDNCMPSDYYCLAELLLALGYKVEDDNFDSEAISIYNQIMYIIGGTSYIPVTEGRLYYGSVEGVDAVTIEEIMASPYVDFESGEEVIINFGMSVPGVVFLAFAEGLALPNWYENVNSEFDQGRIGQEGDLVGVPYAVSTFQVMQGNTNTLINYPIKFYTKEL